MLKKLRKDISKELYHFANGVKVLGKNKNMMGDCSNLNGDCTGLKGDCTDLRGDCSFLIGDLTGLIGDCTGLIGNCSRLCGNLDECQISDEERKKVIDIRELIVEEIYEDLGTSIPNKSYKKGFVDGCNHVNDLEGKNSWRPIAEIKDFKHFLCSYNDGLPPIVLERKRNGHWYMCKEEGPKPTHFMVIPEEPK